MLNHELLAYGSGRETHSCQEIATSAINFEILLRDIDSALDTCAILDARKVQVVGPSGSGPSMPTVWRPPAGWSRDA